MPEIAYEAKELPSSRCTYVFQAFGGIHRRRFGTSSTTSHTKEFSELEQCLLRNAFEGLLTVSTRAHKLAQSRFEGNTEKVYKWFGKSDDYTIDTVIAGVNDMQSILTDDGKIIKFVNAQEEDKVVTECEYESLPEFKYSERAVETHRHTRKSDVERDALQGYSHPLSLAFREEGIPRDEFVGHVGSGYCLYIGWEALHYTTTPTELIKILYQLLAHSILLTHDYNRVAEDVKSKDRCEFLALGDPSQAIIDGGCWANFVTDIEVNKPVELVATPVKRGFFSFW
ncbi:MAG: hypothetical protein KAH18_10400 [Psychromonas sp.]|nr:hypothetical protein [Psychromonas sp.]